jgi:hypothetical protein
MGIRIFCDFCGRGFSQHSKNQLQIGHMIPQIFPP